MKHIHFKEEDTTPVDFEMSVPEQTLRDLICITEKSIKSLAGQMNGMTINVKKMTSTLEAELPAIVKELQVVAKVMNENTKLGITKTDELIKVLEKKNG